MIVSLVVTPEKLAESIVDDEYEAILQVFQHIDDLLADSVFTDMVFDAFAARKRDMGNG